MSEDESPTEPQSGPDAGPSAPEQRREGPDDQPETIAGLPRRTFIRALIVGALGIPIAVESRTLIGLIDQTFFGGERHDGTATASPDEAVMVGDELLPETPTPERLAAAEVRARDADWTFVLEVDVENTTDAPYEFRLTGIDTTAGPVAADSATDTIAPGASGTLTAAIPIPQGSSPTAIEMVGITDPDGAAERVTGRATLGNVPVKRQS